MQRSYDPREVERGWHGWRARLTADDIRLPSRAELRVTETDADLDAREPHERHYVELGQRQAR